MSRKFPVSKSGRSGQIRALIKARSAQNALLLIDQLSVHQPGIVCKPVTSLEELREPLEQEPWDLLLACDEVIPGESEEVLETVRLAAAKVPCLVISEREEISVAVEVMRAGARDFITVNSLDRLPELVSRVIEESAPEKVSALPDATYLAAMVEASDDAIITLLPDGLVNSWNHAAEEMFGWSAREMIGRPITRLIPPEKEAEFKQISERIRRGERISHFETERLDRNGYVISVSLAISPIYDKSESFIGFSKTARNICHQKALEEQVQRNERLFREFMNASNAATFVKDMNGRYLFMNPTMNLLLSPEKRSSWLGKNDFELFPLGIAETCRASDHRCLRSQTPLNIEETGIDSFGNKFVWSVNKFPVSEGIGGMIWDVTENATGLERLQLHERALEASTEGLMIADANLPDHPMVFISPACEKITGYKPEELLGKNLRFLQGSDPDPVVRSKIRESIRLGVPVSVELINYRKDGTPFWNSLRISPIRDVGGMVTHYVGVQSDITERRVMEEQFRQSQKMEAVGKLAGAVSHDFNNYLTIINGYTDMVMETLAVDDPVQEMLVEIGKAGESSAALTRQLLAFSRQQVVQPRRFSLREAVADISNMLGRLMGENIELITLLDEETWPIFADKGSLEQVVMNLAVNGRDAMPDGGRLTISTRNVERDHGVFEDPPTELSGPMVLLEVTDTGTGIPPEIMQKIFEPFFTTKGEGHGTGLGLSTVRDIIRQSGGQVKIRSRPMAGTTFQVYFPKCDEAQRPSDQWSRFSSPPKGEETVLLAEDDPAIRTFMKRVMTGAGYKIIEACNGEEAISLAHDYEKPIHLVLSDVVMPHKGGRELVETVLRVRPASKVLYVSGYTDDEVLRHGVLRDKVNFLQKPFSANTLLSRVRDTIDGPSGL